MEAGQVMPANTLPADFAFPEELPPDFQFPEDNGVAYPPDIVSVPAAEAPQDLAWWEAAFPRSTEAAGAPWYSPQALAAAGLDVASIPGRAYASLARPEGESYASAMGRIAPPEVMPQAEGRIGGEFSDRLAETILRDPATAPMVAAGGLGVPGWLARAGWLGRGVASGAPAGGVMAASRQAENIAAGRPMSPGEAGTDLALGTAFGVGGEGFSLAGRGMIAGAKRGLQQIIKPGTAKQGQEIQEFRRALDAGLLPEMTGWTTATAQDAGRRFGERLAAREVAYPRILAEADMTGRRVNVGRALANARGDVADQIARGRLPASADEAQEALGWVAERAALPDDPTALRAMLQGAPQSYALSLTPSVAQARKSALWKEAFRDPTKSTARASATKAAARSMADELGQISPALAAQNAQMAPWYAAAPAMIRAAGPRGNAYGIGPMEALGFIGGTGAGFQQEGLGGGFGGGIGGLLAVRALRSPAAMRALYDAGRTATAVAPAARRLAPLLAPQTDNARGAR
jgi:hypothetical protein